MPDGINTYSESSLHAALKTWYAKPDDHIEVDVDGSIIDIVRDDMLIEIQTGNFSALKRKLTTLLEAHTVRVVHPIPLERFIVKFDDGVCVSRRRSPKKGHVTQVFNQLVYLYHLVPHPHFSLEVLLTRDEEIRVNDGRGSWRRKGWSISDRRLLEVVESVTFHTAADLLGLLPEALPATFTTADLAKAIKQRRRVAQQMAYCLRELDLIQQTGKQGRAYLYERC